MLIQTLLENMWTDYCQLNPEALRVYDLLSNLGEKVINDHIALRTFDHPKLGIESLAKTFTNAGYVEKKDYFFSEKKLYAKHYEHADSSLPKIFISQLELGKVSNLVRTELTKLIEQIPESEIKRVDFSMSGRPWKAIDYNTYLALAAESEYASWVAAHGFRPNHFTVNFNALTKFTELSELNLLLEQKGFTLNKSGGAIKGTPEDLLEQSSTMANEISVQFADSTHKIPGCYYEFAKRYKMPNGSFYQGFVAASADKIFESTNHF